MGGPDLDWDRIQPLLFESHSDVLIILDCCYAGQAFRSRPLRRVEVLAATDKDQITATGLKEFPSFTKGLIDNMYQMMRDTGMVTISEIHRRMCQAETGLMRQPFYVVLGDGGVGGGMIKLVQLPGTMIPVNVVASSQQSFGGQKMYLSLSLFDTLDSGTTMSLVQWLTKDSPSSIEDIQLVDSLLSDAGAKSKIGLKLLAEDDASALLQQLSPEGQLEASRLLRALQDALSTSPTAEVLSDVEAMALIQTIRKKSDDLVTFMEDSLTRLSRSSLDNLQSEAGQSLKDLQGRIAMRIALIANDKDNSLDSHAGSIRVSFADTAVADQRLRIGRRGGQNVLVEYLYYDNSDPNSYNWMVSQVRKVAALHSEPKSQDFRCLQGLGFCLESLVQARFGTVYILPEGLTGCSFRSLSELIGRLKVVPLEVRQRLAASLCNALLHLHSIGWYHKNIMSRNILLFSSKPRTSDSEAKTWTDWDMDNPFLLGFDCSRPSDAETRNTIDFTTTNNIYRHPERWGRPMSFQRYHDLYAMVSSIYFMCASLHDPSSRRFGEQENTLQLPRTFLLLTCITTKGILLLEIGLWRTLPAMDSKGKGFDHVADPETLRTFLLRAAAEKLSHAAGSRYAKAVQVCLEKRDWTTCEDWQAQKIVRQEVLMQLQ